MKSGMLLDRLTQTVESFSQKKGVVIGDVILDEYLFGKVQRISPEAPVPVVTLDGREIHLGGAANVALNLKSLGASTFLLGVIGDDSAGREFFDLMRREGIPEKGIVVDPGRKTTIKTRVVGRGQQMLRIDKEITTHIGEEITKELLERIQSLEDLDFIIFEDYNKGLLTPSLIREIMSTSKDRLKAVDPKFDNFFAYKGCDLFKPNLRELLAVTGSNSEDEEFLKGLFLRVREKIGAKWLVVTRGEKGFVVVRDRQIVKIPAWRREVFDVTGAGDTVISVLTLATAQGLDIIESTILASLAAGIEVGKFGASTVYPEELKEAVRENAGELNESIEIVPLGR